MHTVSVYPGQVQDWYGKRFNCISFLLSGRIDMLTYDEKSFFHLKRGCVFGDYQAMFHL